MGGVVRGPLRSNDVLSLELGSIFLILQICFI